MKVREVHTGGAGGGSYVVLQMWTGGQNFVGGHKIDVYDGEGTKALTFTFAEGVSSGNSQATILVAGEGYAAAFPSGPTPDETDSGLDIPAAGGAVCFEAIDCVSWGDFEGSLPSAAGEPASPGGVTAGKALHRSIAEPCATLLEPGDDSNDSAADFSEQEPNPRSNSSPIVEEECVPPDETPPDTLIGTHPPNPSDGDVSFTYHSSEGGSTFECSLAGGAAPDAFEGCSVEGRDYSELANGEYTFKVRAEDESGNVDPSPAAYTWTVDESAPDVTPPTVQIDSAPPNPSESSTATFTYSANEAATFECRLDGGSFAPCPDTGKTYEGIGNGSHTFEVIAIDEAENVSDPAAGYNFDVVLPEEDPPPPTPTDATVPPPPPPPPSTPPPPPGILLAGKVAPVKGAVALLRARCLGQPGARCSGALRLVARVRTARAGRRRVRNVVIGRARYGLPAGSARTVRVRLTGRGKRLVRRAGKRGLAARLLGPGVRSRAVKLRAAKRMRRRGGARR